MAGCSHQYELNSVKLVADRMKGGAVRLDKSPLKEAMLCRATCGQYGAADLEADQTRTLRKAAQLLPLAWACGADPDSIIC